MCTVSWIRGEEGYVLLCNRDERRERGPEVAPTVLELDGARAIAPRDGDFGGTWVAVNEHGLALCVLNGYLEPDRAAAPGEARSRGLLALELAGATSVDELARRFRAAELAPYRSFLLLALEPGRPAATFEWNGRERALELDADGRMPLVSSSYDPAAVRARRASLWATATAEGATAAQLEAFHASHAGGPSAYSVCMHRPDAETRSSTRVEASASEVRLRHTPGPPCRTRPGPVLALPRRARAGASARVDA